MKGETEDRHRSPGKVGDALVAGNRTSGRLPSVFEREAARAQRVHHRQSHGMHPPGIVPGKFVGEAERLAAVVDADHHAVGRALGQRQVLRCWFPPRTRRCCAGILPLAIDMISLLGNEDDRSVVCGPRDRDGPAPPPSRMNMIDGDLDHAPGHDIEQRMGGEFEIGAGRGIGHQSRAGEEQRTLLAQHKGSIGTGPEAFP